jgi:hypothetical protein
MSQTLKQLRWANPGTVRDIILAELEAILGPKPAKIDKKSKKEVAAEINLPAEEVKRDKLS